VLEIQDSGQGMPEAVRARIFDPFFTTKEVGSGTGLGLYIVKREIDRHHGQIVVETTVGQGTTFRITLPRSQPNEEGMAA
jgi:signal transduction histidine kinase